MGIAFGPDQDLYIIDNPGWTGREDLVYTGRVLRVRMNGDTIEKVTVVAKHMEHPNGIRIKGDYMYLTQSTLANVKTESGKLMSCVYRFHLDDHDIDCTNTLEDKHILCTFITENPAVPVWRGRASYLTGKAGLIIGNFGDGSIHRLTLDDKGGLVSNELWCQDQKNLLTTDGMTIDPYGNIYVADFSANAIGRISPEGVITRIAQSPDCDGLNGGLDEPGRTVLLERKADRIVL